MKKYSLIPYFIFIPVFSHAFSSQEVLIGISIQKFKGVDVYTSSPGSVGYGSSFEVDFKAKKKNGKEKKIRPGNKKFRITVDGGILDGNRVVVTSRPESPGLYAVKVKIEQRHFLGKKVVDSLYYPIDFNTQLMLDFSGKRGKDGEDGDGNWTKPLFGRDGKDGSKGGDGENGTDGKDLGIRINSFYSKIHASELFSVEVSEKGTSKNYFYYWIENEKGISIDASGGSGGNGGDGGRGGPGKDGEYIEAKDKYKEAGAGGNAGDGGNGGNAGNGGDIDISLDEKAAHLMQYINTENHGGYGGNEGDASEKFGRAGTALEGKYQPSDGMPGNPGQPGMNGMDGKVKVRVE